MTLYIIRPDNNVLDAVHLHLSKLHPQKSFDVTIEPHKAKRTLQQNAYIHVLADLLVEFSGYTLVQIKRMLAAKCDLFDIYPINGKMEKSPKHTSDMTVKELNEVISMAQTLCMELGIKYPDPNWYGYE